MNHLQVSAASNIVHYVSVSHSLCLSVHCGSALVMLHVASAPGSDTKKLPWTGAPCSPGRGRREDGKPGLVLKASAQKWHSTLPQDAWWEWTSKNFPLIGTGPAEREPGLSGGAVIWCTSKMIFIIEKSGQGVKYYGAFKSDDVDLLCHLQGCFLNMIK